MNIKITKDGARMQKIKCSLLFFLWTAISISFFLAALDTTSSRFYQIMLVLAGLLSGVQAVAELNDALQYRKEEKSL